MTKELGRDDKHLQNFIEQQHPYSDLTGRIELFFSNDVMLSFAKDRPGR